MKDRSHQESTIFLLERVLVPDRDTVLSSLAGVSKSCRISFTISQHDSQRFSTSKRDAFPTRVSLKAVIFGRIVRFRYEETRTSSTSRNSSGEFVEARFPA